MGIKLSQEQVLMRFREVHENLYDYSKVNYKNSKTKVEIICSLHGSFFQEPASHIHQKSGCPKCAEILIGSKNRTSHNDFIKQCKLKHENKYSYNKTVYISSDLPIIITCPIHGNFEQIASNHLHHGKGCNKCKNDDMRDLLIMHVDEFISKSNNKFDSYFDYSDITFTGTKNNVLNIKCPEHGYFDQNGGNHLVGKIGCPGCKSNGRSNAENTIYDYIKSLFPNIDILTNTKQIITPQELDIVLPSKKIAIEYNGTYWHSELKDKDKYYHINKTKKANEAGYRLIHIFEDEFIRNPDLVYSRISSILSANIIKVYGARKLKIKSIIDNNEIKIFLNSNHIQGYCNSSIAYGLYENDELLGIMTFGKSRYSKKHDFELIRYCSKKYINIAGGASKLLKHFIKHHNPKSIISYSDIRWNTGDLYKVLGFSEIRQSAPNYFYFHKKHTEKLISRIHFQKHKLKNKLETFDPLLTEWENMKKNSYNRIWDCGNMVFEWVADNKNNDLMM